MFFGSVGKQNSTLIWHEIIFKIISKSYSLKDIITTDNDRRILLDAKYKLSKHPLLSLIIDYVNDYESSRWKWEDGGLFRGKTFYGAERFSVMHQMALSLLLETLTPKKMIILKVE
ncbi:hypothetical protein [Salmonella phage SD-1_S14]|nr:hypothetical protein [Salmonella phage SD-1_S14]